MGSDSVLRMLLGAALAPGALVVLWALLRAVTIEVEDGEAAVITRFGKLDRVVDEPGLHLLADRLLPWVGVRKVSLRRDYREVRGVHVNDARGTTVIVDLWVEFRVADPVKALFAVADWDRALLNLVSHGATSILGNRDFHAILCDRDELGTLLQNDVRQETERWGIAVEHVFIRNVTVLPDVARQLFQRVAARLERAKADVVEEGRLRVAMLEAETSAQVAELRAEAKAQYSLAVGRALDAIGARPEVRAAYEELYELSLARPHRMIAFRGFEAGELRAVDAAMLAPTQEGQLASAVAPLTGADVRRIA